MMVPIDSVDLNPQKRDNASASWETQRHFYYEHQ
jgi:hypothetical protein